MRQFRALRERTMVEAVAVLDDHPAGGGGPVWGGGGPGGGGGGARSVGDLRGGGLPGLACLRALCRERGRREGEGREELG